MKTGCHFIGLCCLDKKSRNRRSRPIKKDYHKKRCWIVEAFLKQIAKGVKMKILNDNLRAPITTIENDKSEILKYHEGQEIVRSKFKKKERFDAINTIKNLIDEWEIKPDEILECERSDEYFLIRDEEPYGPDYSEEALAYSKEVHDLFGFDYECKECLKRATCSTFSNFENLFRSGECDGVKQLLDAGIIKDIEDFYLQKERETE
jgi:hypothetical protein